MRVLWVTHTAIKPFLPEEHFLSLTKDVDLAPSDIAFKFIFWEDGGDRQPLLLVGGLELSGHPELYLTACRLMTLKPSSSADGAGNIDLLTSHITGWNSFHLEINTPFRLREAIKKALGLLS
jgi:hypothetical protein